MMDCSRIKEGDRIRGTRPKRAWQAWVVANLVLLGGLELMARAADVAEAPGDEAHGPGKPFQESGPGEARTNSALGIGFLWTPQSRLVAGRLSRENDFVDIILGPGRMDVFERVRPPVRVSCIALALERNEGRPFLGLKEIIELLRKNGIGPERVLLAYNPERQPGTPAGEMDDLVGSARRAFQMAKAYGAPLIVGPGLREMSQREDLYPELARYCDVWLIQSQRLQLDAETRKPVDPVEYGDKVQAIVSRLREGNPRIRVIVQIVTTAELGQTVLSADEVAGFARALEGIADGVRIYGARGELLRDVIRKLRPQPAGSKITPRAS